MPTRYKDYPIYTYDEPASYSDFVGGINTDPSNDHLLKNELRDCVNMHYLSGALVKRKGAKKLCDITCDDDLTNIQGIFLFTYKITFIIIAADGKLYQGVFNENTSIKLNRLYIYKVVANKDYVFDPSNAFAGIEVKEPSELIEESKHNGYIQVNFRNNSTGELLIKNNRGAYSDITGGAINKGDVVTAISGIIENEYLCINTFVKESHLPTDTLYWEALGETYTFNGVEYNATTIKENEINELRSENLYRFSLNDLRQRTTKDYCIYGGQFYKCINPHYNRANSIYDKNLFVNLANNTQYEEREYLIFQNYQKIEAATLNNKLYIATGTRIIEISMVGDELRASPVEPYRCNYTEITNIGYNYMSPYPELAVASQKNTVTTSITGINIMKTVRNRYKLQPVMNIQIGDSLNNYFYRWEKNIDGKWYVIISFASQMTNEEKPDYSAIEVDDADKYQYRVTFARAFETNTDGDYNVETLPYYYTTYDEQLKVVEHFDTTQDYVINKITGEYFGSAVSVLFNNDLELNDTFNIIQSCTKILVDGQKILYYGDKYNSGQWFKTIINNPGYITDRGCLSFKTTKNEELIKVVPFQGNLIAFANAEQTGGSIHIIKGNGDDYDDQSGYYSPYQRSTINASISCDNPDTVQICDNILVFKYFDRIYYINASDLSNDVVKVTPCNDRVRTSNQEVSIPRNDNDCISEVTDTYYALIWKEKYTQDSKGDLILERPGTRVKMYYKIPVQTETNVYAMPWLRDESDVFNSKFIIYVKGKPLYLYHNVLVTFDEEYYKDLGEDYKCKIHFRGEALNYPTMFKLLEHIIINYHRNQYNKVDIDVLIRNEAGHVLLDSDSKRKSIGDLAALKADTEIEDDVLRLDSTIQDSKLINTVNMFPFILADTTIIAKTKGSFTLSGVTYNYTSTDSPDQNPYDLYTNIIRPKEVK